MDALALPIGEIAIIGHDESTEVVSTLDLVDGATVWEHEFSADVDSSQLVAATERSVVVQVNRASGRGLAAFDAADGSPRWSIPSDRDVAFGSLPGSFAIAEYTFDPLPPFTERLAFIDPDTGRRLSRVDGTIAATDWDGTWYVRAGTELLAYDLSGNPGVDGAGTGARDLEATWTEPVRVAARVPRAITALAVANGILIGIDGRGILVDATSNDVIQLPPS